MIEISSGKGKPPRPTTFYDYTDPYLAAHHADGTVIVYINDGTHWAEDETEETYYLSPEDRKLKEGTVTSWTVFTLSLTSPPPEKTPDKPLLIRHGDIGEAVISSKDSSISLVGAEGRETLKLSPSKEETLNLLRCSKHGLVVKVYSRRKSDQDYEKYITDYR